MGCVLPWLLVVLSGGSGNEGGDDVGGVPVEADPSAVVTHGRVPIGVAGGFLHVALRDPASSAAVMNPWRRVCEPSALRSHIERGGAGQYVLVAMSLEYASDHLTAAVRSLATSEVDSPRVCRPPGTSTSRWFG
jgi:hypothetical protein